MALPAQPSRLIRFGPFELNATNGELRKAGVSLKLHPQPFQVLLLLAERTGQIVTREEIQHCLWRDNTFVDFERGINFCINQIRTALGDDAEQPRYVETLPRRGYRFIAPVAADQGKNPPVSGKVWKFTLPLTLICLIGAVITGGLVLLSSHTRRLTEKDTIVLADFSNSTGDSVFDGTLRQGLAVQLEQSPFLSLISDERMRQTLRLMGQSPDAKLTPEISRELCQRTDSAAVLRGSIASLGKQYVVGLKAENCRTGDSLAEEQETANSKEKVLTALSQGAAKLREKLGESLKSIQKFDAPLEQATTPSLAALQAYSLGRKTFVGADSVAAIPYLQRATQLDPNFAQAYAVLSISYKRLGQFQLSEETARKAYELRERVSEPERFYIELHYYETVPGDLEKARETGELWSQIYPRNAFPLGNLSSIYAQLGQHDKALAAAVEALRLDPGVPMRPIQVLITYIDLNRFREARTVAEEVQARRPDASDLHAFLYRIAFCEGDTAGMAREVAWSEGKPGFETSFFDDEANTSAYYGKMKLARKLADQASSLEQRAERNVAASNYEVGAAFREAFFGSAVEARRRVSSARKLLSAAGRPDTDIAFTEATIEVLLGDTARSEALANQLAKRYPEDTLVQNNLVPAVRAQIAIHRGNPMYAIELLERARPYELAFGDKLASAFVRGNAYLGTRRPAEAASEFQRILDHRGLVGSAPWGALAHVGLARAYALQGDTGKAEAAYEDFFTLWKDADPDIPILKQAKAEYAKLR